MKKDCLLTQTKKALEKAHGRPITEEETEQALAFMRIMAAIQVENLLEATFRQLLLQTAPGGFHFSKPGYACSICQGDHRAG